VQLDQPGEIRVLLGEEAERLVERQELARAMRRSSS
jgi:hypothetical protein